jgi:hypothetical protein
LRLEGILEALRPFDQGVGVRILLDFLPSIRKCNDKLIIVPVGLTADFVEQARVVSFEKPNHCWSYRPLPGLSLAFYRPIAAIGSILDAR